MLKFRSTFKAGQGLSPQNPLLVISYYIGSVDGTYSNVLRYDRPMHGPCDLEIIWLNVIPILMGMCYSFGLVMEQPYANVS